MTIADLLPRRDRAEHVLADGTLGRLVDELPHHRQRDVRLRRTGGVAQYPFESGEGTVVRDTGRT
mgnify:CR=1 FL=1